MPAIKGLKKVKNDCSSESRSALKGLEEPIILQEIIDARFSAEGSGLKFNEPLLMIFDIGARIDVTAQNPFFLTLYVKRNFVSKQ